MSVAGAQGRLEGKVALITGAAKGIGQATARKFVQEGARVVVADIDAEGGQAVAASLDAGPAPEWKQELLQAEAGPTGVPVGGPRALFVRCDVRSRESLGAALEFAAARFGGVDIVVNNCGVQSAKGLMETSAEEWEEVLRTNLSSVFHALQLAVPHMRRRGGGSIVNVSSTFAVVGSPGYAAYHASKGGVSSLTRASAIGLMTDNIRVNAVCPGTTLTPGLVQGAEVACQEGTKTPAELMDGYLQRQPLKRFGSPEEIAAVIAFVASGEASFMVGANVMVDGGYTII